jgi:hypothetical protein
LPEPGWDGVMQFRVEEGSELSLFFDGKSFMTTNGSSGYICKKT